ncbi:MAG: acyltransferase family protein [Pseudoclavibacter sp.]
MTIIDRDRPAGATRTARRTAASGALARTPHSPRTAVAVGDGRRPVTRRDSTIDVARAWCLVIVVVLHSLMVGVSYAEGAPLLENALDGWSGLAALTWVVQIMPLFFLLGGASSLLHWRKMNRAAAEHAGGQDERGDGRGLATRYLATRVPRLVRPALAAGIAVASLITLLYAVGVPGDLVAEAGFRMSQPLWFLGVYLLCSAAVPFVARAHERAPWLALGGLVAAAVGVEAARVVTGIDAIGFANLLFVWLAVQQLGFFIADGSTKRLPRGRLVPLAAAALVGAAVVAGFGLAPFDLLEALNPPSPVLILVGVAQLFLFEAARPMLARIHELPGVARVVAWMNARAMTFYSWHMLVLVTLAGGLLLSGWSLPAPLSGDWWATRPLWIAAVAAIVVLVVAAVGRYEVGGPKVPGTSPKRLPAGPVRVWSGALVGAAGTLVVLAGTGSLLAWAIGVGAWMLAIVLVRGRRAASADAAVSASADDTFTGGPATYRIGRMARPRS